MEFSLRTFLTISDSFCPLLEGAPILNVAIVTHCTFQFLSTLCHIMPIIGDPSAAPSTIIQPFFASVTENRNSRKTAPYVSKSVLTTKSLPEAAFDLQIHPLNLEVKDMLS